MRTAPGLEAMGLYIRFIYNAFLCVHSTQGQGQGQGQEQGMGSGTCGLHTHHPFPRPCPIPVLGSMQYV